MRRRRSTGRLKTITFGDIPVQTIILSTFFLLGILMGYLTASHWAKQTGDELSRYLEDYLALGVKKSWSVHTVVQTLLCFFRAPVIMFLAGFASIGVLIAPFVSAAQGFLFSFSLFCFASALGRNGFFILLLLFSIRLLFVIPWTLILGCASLQTASLLAAFSLGNGSRSKPVHYGSHYWVRFGSASICLFLGAILELWLIPRILIFLVN